MLLVYFNLIKYAQCPAILSDAWHLVDPICLGLFGPICQQFRATILPPTLK